MDINKTSDAFQSVNKAVSGLSATELLIVVAIALLIIAGIVAIWWIKAYLKTRFENHVARKVGYHAFQRSLLSVGDTIRLPTAVGSETAKIVDLTDADIEIIYVNGDIGHIPFIGFERLNLRKVTMVDNEFSEIRERVQTLWEIAENMTAPTPNPNPSQVLH